MIGYEENLAFQKDKTYHVAFKEDKRFLVYLAHSYKSTRPVSSKVFT